MVVHKATSVSRPTIYRSTIDIKFWLFFQKLLPEFGRTKNPTAYIPLLGGVRGGFLHPTPRPLNKTP